MKWIGRDLNEGDAWDEEFAEEEEEDGWLLEIFTFVTQGFVLRWQRLLALLRSAVWMPPA